MQILLQPLVAMRTQSTQLWLRTWYLLGCKFKGFYHETAMVQVGLWVPTSLAVRKGLSCEFLARL